MATSYYQGQQYNQDHSYGNQQATPPQALPRKRPALPRSISSTNLDKTAHCRSIIQQDWVRDAPPGGTNFFSTVPAFTLTLPNLDKYPSDFQQCVFNQLIDKTTQQYLEGEKCLNWCASTTRFLPLYTMGDGNCLLHAASLSMWGFHDRDHTLRRAVFTALQNHSTTQLYRRWKYTRDQENRQLGIQLEDFQWQREWQSTVAQASTDIPQGKTLESLEDFHIFVLANVLRRPIVMYAAPKVRSQATGGTLQQINFHGIYLPLLWDPNSCKKDPLPLAYYGGHFVALVAVEYPQQYNRGSLTLPLVDFHGQTLPVRFILSMEDPTAMMMDYLRVASVSGHNSPYITSTTVVCASLSIPNRPAYLKPLLTGFLDACGYANQPQPAVSQPGYNHLDQLPPSSQPNQPYYGNASAPPTEIQRREKCINHCGMYGDPEKGGLCSQCYQKHRQTEQQTPLQNQDNWHNLPESTGFVPRSEGPQKCINHCGMQGDPDKGGLCFQCYQKHVRNEQDIHQPGDQYSQFQRNFPAPNERPPYEATPTGDHTRQKCINDCGNYADSSSIGMCTKCLARETEAATASEGRVPEGRQPQQNFVTQGSSFNSGSIKCPKCPNPGQPSFLGMCERCYHANNSGRQPSPQRANDHIYETIPGPAEGEPPPPTQDPNARSKCRTPNCEFFGTAQTANYCSQCFEKDMERILREADTPSGHQQQQAPPLQFQQQQQAPPPQFQQQRQASPPQFRQERQAPPSQFQQQLQAPPPQFQQHVQNVQPELPVQQKTGGEAQKCYKCQEFFANVEYQGLCSGCFMEKTKVEAKETPPKQTFPEPFNQAPRYEPCLNRNCRNLADIGGYCSECLRNQSEPRQRVATAPQGYTPRYEKCMNMDCNGPRTENGYCDNCNMAGGRSYAATQHIGPTHQQQNIPSGVRPTPKPRQKINPTSGGNVTTPIAQLSSGVDHMTIEECFMCSPSHSGIGSTNVLCRHHAQIMKQMMPGGVMTAGSHGDAVKSKPQGTINSPQEFAMPQGRGVYTESHVQQGPQSTQYSSHTQPHPRQNPGGFPSHTQNRNYDNYQRQPPQPGQTSAPPQLGQSQQQRGSHAGAQQFGTDLSHGGIHGQPGYEATPPPIQPRQTNHTPGNPAPRQRSGEVQFGVNMEPPPREMNGGGAQGATGGGALGGGYQGGEVLKQLCATAGCSFKGYRELYNLCPDCYEAKYQRKAPEQFPLV